MISLIVIKRFNYDNNQTIDIMALQDLIINNKQISTELIENLLKGRVELIQEGKKVGLTKEGMNLSNKGRVLLFLAGGKAWELLDSNTWSSSPAVMQEFLGIPGNTLRPILRELADEFFVKSEKGKYQILSKGIYELESMIENKRGRKSDILDNDSRLSKSISTKKATGSPSKSKAIEDLIDEGYFSDPRELGEIQVELGRRGVSVKLTSLPSYVLSLVRKKVLTREHKIKGKGRVWIYKLYK